MLCGNCGTSNRDDEKFCRGCLQPISAASDAAPRAATASGSVPDAAFEAATGDYAGFWRRFAAVFLDSIILMVVLIPLLVIAAVVGGSMNAESGGGLFLLVWLLLMMISAAYFILMEAGERGATFGKRALKIRVVDLNGERISVGRSVGRFVGHFLSGVIPFYIGYLMQVFTERRQALHDMVSGTVVVRTDEGEGSSGAVIVVVGLFFFLVVFIGILAAVAIPAYQDYVVKAKMVQASQFGNQASKAVEKYWAESGRVPESIAETRAQLQTPAYVSDVEINPGSGEVQIVFADSLPRSVAGKSLNFKPVRYVDGTISWQCGSNEISPKLLPKECK